MNLEEYKGVYVFAQQVDGEVSSIAYELLGKAKDLAKESEYRGNRSYSGFRHQRPGRSAG